MCLPRQCFRRRRYTQTGAGIVGHSRIIGTHTSSLTADIKNANEEISLEKSPLQSSISSLQAKGEIEYAEAEAQPFIGVVLDSEERT